MTHPYLIIASTETAEKQSDLFGALGIDARLLIVQLLSFLVLFWVLKKFVFPSLQKALDEREKMIVESVEAAKSAQQAAEASEETIKAELKKAQKEAAGIVETAQAEAARIVEDAEARADKKAAHMLEQAEARLQSDIADAKVALKHEMALLVAQATETIIDEKLDAKKDAALIQKALEKRQ